MTEIALGAHAFDLAPFWIRLAAGLGAGALTWVVAADYGCALATRAPALSETKIRLAVGTALGYALLGSAVGLLGLARLITPVTLSILIFVAFVARAPWYLRRLRQLPQALKRLLSWFAASDGATQLATIAIAAAAFTAVVNAALPAVWWDPIAYHLPLVAAALARGTFAFDPGMVQSGFPQLGEAAALPAYALAGSAGAAMSTLGAGLCVVVGVWALAERLVAGAGPVAGMLAATSALWAWLAPSFYVDVPFAAFVLAAILAATALRSASPDGLFAVALVTGAMCGAAASVKYTGLGATAVVIVVVLATASQRWRALAGLGAGFAIVAAGWYARTFALTTDVVYPFWTTSSSASAIVASFATNYATMTEHWCGGGSSALDLLLLPYRLLAAPRQFCGDPGLALQVGAIFAIIAAVASPPARKIALAALALTVLWFASSQQWRFLLPAVLLVCALGGAGLAASSPLVRRLCGIVLAALGLVTVATNWLPQTQRLASASLVPAYAYLAGQETAGQYLDARLETFAAARWLAARGIPGVRIAALDDVRNYYFPTGTIWANPFYQQDVAIDWQAPPGRRYAALTARGIRYLVVNENPAYVHRTPTGVDWAVLASDERNSLKVVFSANGVSVVELGGPR